MKRSIQVLIGVGVVGFMGLVYLLPDPPKALPPSPPIQAPDATKIAFGILDKVEEKAASKVTVTKAAIIVEYCLDPFEVWSETQAKRDFLEKTFKLSREYFTKFPELGNLQIIGTSMFRDNLGNRTRLPAMTIELTRESLIGANWDNMKASDLTQVASKYWVDSSFNK